MPASFASTKLESDITLIRESPLDSFSSENALERKAAGFYGIPEAEFRRLIGESGLIAEVGHTSMSGSGLCIDSGNA